MNKFSIDESFRHGWEIFKANKKVLILATIIIMLLGGIGKSNQQHEMRWGILATIVSLVFFIVSVVLQIGWYKLLLKFEDGLKPKLGELLGYEQLFFKFLITQVISGILVLVGFILLIVPGVYFLLTYGFASLIAVDTNLSISESFKESKRITAGSKGRLFLFFVAVVALNIIGAIALVVGLLVSIPVSMLAYIHVYRTLLKAAPVVVPEPVV